MGGHAYGRRARFRWAWERSVGGRAFGGRARVRWAGECSVAGGTFGERAVRGGNWGTSTLARPTLSSSVLASSLCEGWLVTGVPCCAARGLLDASHFAQHIRGHGRRFDMATLPLFPDLPTLPPLTKPRDGPPRAPQPLLLPYRGGASRSFHLHFVGCATLPLRTGAASFRYMTADGLRAFRFGL